MSEKPKIVVYQIGFDETVFPDFKSIMGTAEYHSIVTMEQFSDLAEQELFSGILVPIVLCDSLIPELAASEIAQIARMKFPEARIYYITKNRDNYDKKAYLKNGYTDSFLLPIDKTMLTAVLKEVSSLLDPENVVLMKLVKLVDIDSSTNLDFDIRVRLPRNKKYVTHSRKGEAVDATRLNKLSQGSHDTLTSTRETQKRFINIQRKS